MSHTSIPIELGRLTEIVIGVRSAIGRFPDGSIYGGEGVMGYSLQVRDGAMDGWPVLMYSTPEQQAPGYCRNPVAVRSSPLQSASAVVLSYTQTSNWNPL